jgi:hypothetical protein
MASVSGRSSIRKFGSRRDLVRDLRVADFPLGANDALRQGWRGNQESARDLLGLQATNFSQREGDACIGGEGGVATCKNEPEPVILQAVVVEVRSERCAGLQLFGGCGERRIESRASPEPVYCLEAAGGDEPGARILRHAVAWPRVERGGEGIVQRLLGCIKAAEEADQRCEHAARVGAIECFDLLAHARVRFRIRGCGRNSTHRRVSHQTQLDFSG